MTSAASRQTLEGKPRFPVPEPGLTPAELIARAAALRPLIRAEQDDSERRGHYSEALHLAFKRAGLYRALQPRLFGGYEFDVPTFYQAMIEISRGDPGTGWCLTLAASHPYLVASHWSERAQYDFFSPDGEFAAPHRALPSGTCEPVVGGYVIDGVWNYASGIPWSTHFIGATLLHDHGGPPRPVNFVVRRDQLTVLDDWGGERTLGMRASGSNSVKIDRVFVPEHHVVPFGGLYAWPEDVVDGTPGTRLHGNPMYLGRVMAPYHASLSVPVIGAARAAIDEFEELIGRQNTIYPPFEPKADHHDFQRPLGQAIAMTDAAEAVVIGALRQHMDHCARWQKDGTPFTIEENLRLWGMIQQGAKLAYEAVDLLFANASSSASKAGSRLQRYYRDVAMYKGHISSQQLTFATFIARAHLHRPIGGFGLDR